MREKIEQGLSQKSLVTMIRERLSGLTDVRTGKNSRYELSGHAKQDCELVAAGRWLQREGQRLAAHHVTILGDDLFSHQPHCEKIIAENMHFILVCKPESHTTLYEWLADFEREN